MRFVCGGEEGDMSCGRGGGVLVFSLCFLKGWNDSVALRDI